jgi:hypothetical protein
VSFPFGLVTEQKFVQREVVATRGDAFYFFPC